MNDIKLYTMQEIADMFQVALVTVKYWRKNGILKGIKVGRAVRFTQEEINNLLKDKSGSNEK